MANSHKGEVEFQTGDEKLKLRFSANAMVELEAAFDMSVSDLGVKMSEAKSLRFADLLKILRIGLQDHYGDDVMTDERIKAVSKALLPTELTDIVGRAFSLSFGVDPAAAANGAANPQTPGAPNPGTGPASTNLGVH